MRLKTAVFFDDTGKKNPHVTPETESDSFTAQVQICPF